MNLYVFDENDGYYRNPITPLEAPGVLRLKIKTLCGKVAKARVNLHPDGREMVGTDMRFAGVEGSYDIYACEIDIQKPGLYWFNFQLYATYGAIVAVPEHLGGAFQLTAYAPNQMVPEWIYGGMIYHLFVDRFNNSGGPNKIKPGDVFRPDWGATPHFLPDKNGIVRNNDFFGGDLQGIIQKLPYLEQLGVTCIYLSPIFEAASNHKYDTGDYMKIDPSFGTEEDFEQLCTEAGKLGMKVILDGVFNHVGADSKYFNKYGRYDSIGAYQGRSSPYYYWFNFKEDGTYDSWWGIDTLPSINESSKSFIEHICGKDGVIAHWSEKGVSGWRLDVVDELPDVFLDPLCNAMKTAYDQSFIVGEVWEDASNKIAYDVRRRYFQGGQLDSVTNYPLKVAIIACIKDNDVERLANAVATLCRNYPPHILHGLMNILGTHDTMRILTVLGGDEFPEGRPAMSKYSLDEWQLKRGKSRLKLASTLQFTLPGVPCVYYGDEAGMEGGADPFCRRCYPWGYVDSDLISWYTTLSKIRKGHSAFIYGNYTLVEARNGIYAFTRGKGNDRVLVAINMSDEDRVIKTDDFNYDILNDVFADKIVVKAGKPAIYVIKEKINYVT